MPTSTYNLRTASKSTSKTGSPIKQGQKSANTSPIRSNQKSTNSPSKSNRTSISKDESPRKKQAKVDHPLGRLDQIDNVPIAIIKILANNGIETLEQLKVTELNELAKKFPGSKGECVGGIGVEIEIVKAWLKCLHARATDPNTKFVRWIDWLEGKIQERSITGKSQTTKNSLVELQAAARLLVSRKELVKQRQTLKKSKSPVSKQISFVDLKVAKSKLIAVPSGKALKGKIQSDTLASIKSKLKKTNNPTN